MRTDSIWWQALLPNTPNGNALVVYETTTACYKRIRIIAIKLVGNITSLYASEKQDILGPREIDKTAHPRTVSNKR